VRGHPGIEPEPPGERTRNDPHPLADPEALARELDDAAALPHADPREIDLEAGQLEEMQGYRIAVWLQLRSSSVHGSLHDPQTAQQVFIEDDLPVSVNIPWSLRSAASAGIALISMPAS
jgi:hypothetical protein